MRCRFTARGGLIRQAGRMRENWENGNSGRTGLTLPCCLGGSRRRCWTADRPKTEYYGGPWLPMCRLPTPCSKDGNRVRHAEGKIRILMLIALALGLVLARHSSGCLATPRHPRLTLTLNGQPLRPSAWRLVARAAANLDCSHQLALGNQHSPISNRQLDPPTFAHPKHHPTPSLPTRRFITNTLNLNRNNPCHHVITATAPQKNPSRTRAINQSPAARRDDSSRPANRAPPSNPNPSTIFHPPN